MKIAFTDFWGMFIPNHNFFYYMLEDIYGDIQVTSPEDCDILLYGPYGKDHQKFDPQNKIKIFVTGENLRPNFEECTYSFSFDFDDYQGRNVRIPLWFMQFDWYKKDSFKNPEFVIGLDKIDDNDYIQNPKTKFCVLVNNNLFDDRVQCVHTLSDYKQVECFGKPFGNWFYGESKKYELFSNFKFSICFENSVAPDGGYYTEKLIHAKLAGTLPLYYADEKVELDFNTKSFLNLNDYSSMNQFADHVIQLDKNQEEYEAIVNEPLFNKNPDMSDLEEIKSRVKRMINL